MIYKWIKKILRIICILLPILSLLTININGIIAEIDYQPLNYFSNVISFYPSDILFAQVRHQQILTQLSINRSISTSTSIGAGLYYQLWQKDNLYHIKMKFDNYSLPVGVVQKDSYTKPLILDGDIFADYTPESAEFQIRSNKYHEVNVNNYFYYYDGSFLHAYILSETNYDDCYIDILIGSRTLDIEPSPFKISNISIENVGSIDGKLDTIIEKLDNIQPYDIESAVNNALADHDRYERSEGESVANSLQEKFNEITAPYTEASEAIHECLSGYADIFNYSGTDGTLVFPEGNIPFFDEPLWAETEIDLCYYWDLLPQALKSSVNIILTAIIWISLYNEVFGILYQALSLDESLGMQQARIGDGT